MNYKILVDSCCDLPEEYRKQPHFIVVPLTIDLGGKTYVDDENLDVSEYLRKMKETPKAPQTACPSPEDYMKHFDGDEENIFIVTLSDQLSGSYNSAVLAKNLYNDENPNNNKHITIFNSFSASSAEVLIALKVEALAKAGESTESIDKKVNEYIDGMNTYFVLESLDNLRKNGRLNNVQALIANVLNIKPIMGANKDGTIKKLDQGRGIKKALNRMAEIIGEEGQQLSEKICVIAQCNCPERAKEFKEEILKRYSFKDVIIVSTAGISTTYAYDGGIVVAV
ncbi:DegV family protein with EDD domain [Natranaerovirga pectinivora]|uniref:DegV family protein with EDD domain n=1 Tax=Natranaerovirga pectinivora TaxID=682400 RepID=A0A4R3MQC6_9FIRM|nr:DegV family protein [Natranaerovirga pectinivora]TCT14620.1 DegV family protein with EDD domain [Natranaerovirga pectinivora]